MTYKFKVKAPDQIDVPRICRENKDKDGFVIHFGDYVVFATKAEFELALRGRNLVILNRDYGHWPSFLPDGTLHINSRASAPPEVFLFRFTCLIEEDKAKKSELISEFFKALAKARTRSIQSQNLTAFLRRKQQEVLVTTKS